MTDITAVLNVHGEGILAHASLLSIREARKLAEANGVSVDILIVADCPDQATTAYLAEVEHATILETGVDDLGLARNAGVQAAQGRFIAFLDGDDLWGPNWLLAAFRAARAEPRRTVWHPEASLVFGTSIEPIWLVHPTMETAEGDWVALGIRNHWTALSFAAREIYEEAPYRRTDLAAGFGYEDWSWNEETISRGFLHRPVAGTAHMIRFRQNSLVRRTSAGNALRTPSTLFRDRIGWIAGTADAGIASDDGTRHQNPARRGRPAPPAQAYAGSPNHPAESTIARARGFDRELDDQG